MEIDDEEAKPQYDPYNYSQLVDESFGNRPIKAAANKLIDHLYPTI